ncbi:MAG: type II toxin-antitoxin system VapC family toxin [Bifidobacteriaceae bacterium]|nr:type II toxin-antitoxin system VapC family toxin [Bifidobacteriaceae bacterium]
MTTSVAPVWLLDTNAISESARHPQGPVGVRLAATLPGEAVTSVVVVGELLYGIAKASSPRIKERVDALLAAVPVLAIDAEVASVYGSLRADLERTGTPIGANDLWIAAQALRSGLTVVTGNESEFRRVPGLSWENWSSAPESAGGRH